MPPSFFFCRDVIGEASGLTSSLGAVGASAVNAYKISFSFLLLTFHSIASIDIGTHITKWQCTQRIGRFGTGA